MKINRYYISVIILFSLSVSLFWYTYQFNIYHQDDLPMGSYITEIFSWFNDSTVEDTILPQGFNISGLDIQRIFFILSISFSILACFVMYIHRLKYGVSKMFLPIVYSGIIFALFIVKIAYGIRVL